MCSYIVKTVPLRHSSAKGPGGWTGVDTARVSYDHPYHSALDHALSIDIVSEADGGNLRLALELSPESARELVVAIRDALATGEREHGLGQARPEQVGLDRHPLVQTG